MTAPNQMQLYLAIKNNNLTKVVDLLNDNYDLRAHEFFNDQITFVSLAVISGNEAIVEKLIENGADVNRLSYIDYKWPSSEQMFNSFEPAITTATRHGYAHIVAILLKHAAKVNKTDSFSMSPLHWAASLNLVDIVDMLIRSGANPNLLDLKNQTPLERAIGNGYTEIISLFVNNFSLEFKYRDYLLEAIEMANIEILKLLISQAKTNKVNYDLNLIDDKVGSVLHYAVILSSLNCSLPAMCSLTNHLEIQTNAGKFKLDVNKMDKAKIVELLIDNGVEINIVNKFGETPLHMCRSLEVAQLLLDKGASMNICEITGKMPFYTFICRANYDMCIELLKNGCELENIDKLGNSLLYTIMHNCSNAPIRLIQLLLEAGIALDKEQWIQKREYPKKLLKKYPKLFKAIEYRLKNPPSLKELARNSLRLHLTKVNQSKSILNSVSGLAKILPTTLQDYVLLNLNKAKFNQVLIK